MPFSSKIANDLLWTPFDNKSVNGYGLFDKVTENEFLEECFSQPFFQNTSFKEDVLGLFDDSPVTISDIKYSIKEEKEKFDIFLKWLGMFENHKVYTLSGNSGTGKTTFLHYLKSTIKNYSWTILDVSNSPEKFDWLGDTFTVVKKYDRATRKTFTAILNQIHNLLFNEDSESDKITNIYNNLYSVIENYKQRLKKSRVAGCTLFNDLCIVFSKENLSIEDKVEESATLFSQYFLNDENDDDYALLDKAMDVLLIILRSTDDGFYRRHIIVFDNFERFVTQDEIYNNEINEIRKKLANYDLRINNKNNHFLKFKFIMAIRCSTARICGIKLHPADENPSNMDISSWFHIDDILKRKMEWFKKLSIENTNYDLVRQITGDLRQCKNGDLTGLKLFLDPLFNDNKRLTVDFLGIIIENKENKEKFDYLSCLNKYLENWEINSDISRCAARNIIKGVVLFKLKNIDDLFKNLKALKEDETKQFLEIGTGLARRILTILYNKTLRSNDDILLSEVISELYSTNDILNNWRRDSYSKKRKTLSEIIFHMASYNRRDNDWIQFIDLQHDDMNKKLKISNVKEMESVLYEDFEKFRIAIMPAGVAYLKYIVASFEYFSVRYIKKYQPLFSTVPSQNDIEQTDDVTSLLCYKIINDVKNSALRCIDNIHDNNLKINIKKGWLTHAERIVNFHCFYIDNFISYVQEVYINNPQTSQRAKEKYSLLLEKLCELKNEYRTVKRG